MLIKKYYILTVILLLALSFVSNLNGANGHNRNSAKEIKPWSYQPMQFDTVETELKGLYKLVTEGDQDGKPVHSLYFRGRSRQVALWAKRKWIELETGVQKTWFNKVIAQISYLGKLKKRLELAKYNKQLNTPNARKVIVRYKAAIKKFDELIKNPIKVERSKLNYMKRKRRDWIRVQQKKEKARLAAEKYNKRRNGNGRRY
jgi:hypothetical protein